MVLILRLTPILVSFALWLSPTLALADFTGRVVGVSDGDTITVLRNGREQVKIRLDGIDAPEKDQPFGTQAKTFTSKACFGKNIFVIEKDTDRYGRTIGVVEVGDTNLNLQLVESGFAWWYRRYAATNQELAEAEKTARSLKKGLWRDPFPVAPWDYRKGERQSDPEMFAEDSEKTHWLNLSSEKRHNSECRYFKQGNGRPCTPLEGNPCGICGG